MPKSDLNKAQWEQSEFPILCETCTAATLSYTHRVRADATQQASVTIPSSEWYVVRSLRATPMFRCFVSQNKSLAVRAAPAPVHSPFSVGTPVQALVTKPPSSAKRVPRSRTSVRHVCWISSMVCRPKFVILRWLSRAKLQRATSIASTTHKTWKKRYSPPSMSPYQA